jgi:hypothetical protein
MRVLHQGEATITRPDGSHVPAEVTVWQDETAVLSSWGGRAVVGPADSLSNDVGSTCTLRWPIAGDANMVGAFVVERGQVDNTAETYRMVGSGFLTVQALSG